MKIHRRYQTSKHLTPGLVRATGSVDLDSEESYPATLSTDRLQADGMAVLTNGWELQNFLLRGAPLIVEHGRVGAPPAGYVSNLEVRSDRLVGRVHLLEPGVNPYADAARALVRAGGRPLLSVGFNTKEERPPTKDEMARGFNRGHRIVTRSELVEVSLVGVGMDPLAGFDPEPIRTADLFNLALEAGLL